MALLLPQAARATPFDSSKTECVYSGPIAPLSTFEGLVGHRVSCALVYNDAALNWSGWEDPWFTHHPDPNLNWVKWQQADAGHRRLIITQNLFPADQNNTDWRHAGASGDFTDHARALARRLVAVGQGDAVIRLAHEANGTWYPDSIGDTDEDFALWRQFWRKTVLAMRSVPGAHFEFDLSVNAAYRPIPLDKYYPGDDVVDIIGIDAYDSGIPDPAGPARWQKLDQRAWGTHDLIAFAKAHDKPISLPEWGIGPMGGPNLSAGDDPAYLDGIADIVENNRVAYESYFYAHEWGTQIGCSPQSLLAYQRRFGHASGASAPLPAPAPASFPAASGPATPAAKGSLIQMVVRATRRGGRTIPRRLTVTATASVPGTLCVTVLGGQPRLELACAGHKLSATHGAQVSKVRSRRPARRDRAPRTLALGRTVFNAPGRARVRLRATASGRLAARRARKVTVVSLFVPRSGAPEATVVRRTLR